MSVPNVIGNIVVSNGRVFIGDPVALVADDTVGVLEGMTSFAAGVNSGATKFLFRKDSDGSLATKSAAELRVLTANELTTRNDAASLAALQATFDAAKTALDNGGGDSCDGCA
jgi:hypothetical protein